MRPFHLESSIDDDAKVRAAFLFRLPARRRVRDGNRLGTSRPQNHAKAGARSREWVSTNRNA